MATHASNATPGTGEKSLNQKVGLVFGAVYIVVGLLGFAVTGGVDFIANDGNLLLGIFEINPLHNIVHLLVGVALLGAALKDHPTSRSVNLAVGAVYALVGVLGWFIDGSSANILALNPADHLLHLASAGVLIAVAMRRETATARAQASVVILAHLGHAAVEPVLLFALPATIVGVWELRSRRRRATR